MRGGLMVCGTASDVGKSSVVTGLCRVLPRQGVRVAPFKAQNMANNSYVTPSGHEIGRAQGVQALAAGVEPEVAMNPILLKPTGRADQPGRRHGPARPATSTPPPTRPRSPACFATVLDALADLRSRFDVVIVEGAGSPAEINLLHSDLVNLRLAAAAGLPAIVVGDIDRGGVFAALYGTVALLPDDLRPLVRGFVINKLRGDPALLADGPGRARAPVRRADPRRPARTCTTCPSTPRTRSPCPGRPRPAGVGDARRRRHPLPPHRQLHRPRPAGPRARRSACASSTAPRPSAGPTSSSCPAPRPRSPTSSGCGAGASTGPLERVRRPRCSASAAATRCWAARSSTRSSPGGARSTASAGSTPTTVFEADEGHPPAPGPRPAANG